MGAVLNLNLAGRIDATPDGADFAAGAVMTREQFGDAYDAGYARTIRFLVSRGLGIDAAEESAQAAWAKGWESRDQLNHPGCLLSWVNTIALNLFRKQFRRQGPEQLPADIPVPALQNSPTRIDIQRALAKCTRADRQIIEGCYWAGYTSAELAAGDRSTPGAVRIRLMRVRRRLRERLSA